MPPSHKPGSVLKFPAGLAAAERAQSGITESCGGLKVRARRGLQKLALQTHLDASPVWHLFYGRVAHAHARSGARVGFEIKAEKLWKVYWLQQRRCPSVGRLLRLTAGEPLLFPPLSSPKAPAGEARRAAAYLELFDVP